MVSTLAGCDTIAEVNVYGWKAESSDAKTLTLVVVTAVDNKLLTGEVLSESETDVVVAARVSRLGGSRAAVGVLRQVDVQLTKPIDTRSVVNRDGSEITRQN